MFARLFRRQPSLTPAQRWMLAAGGTLTKLHGDKFDQLPFHYGAKISQRVLADWWDTRDQAGLLKMLNWLDDEGHRAEALERAAEMKEMLAHTTEGSEVELGEMGVFLANNRHIIERVGLDAWDYSRLINVARWGFTAGYLPEADTWTWGLDAARKLQSRYHSWRELGDSIVIGLRYWSVGKLPMPDFSACHEEMISDPKSPWNQIPWNTPLTE
jgi:hypothetical protein